MEREPVTNGVDRCRSCGSSDISFDGSWLVCGYCHQRWNTAVLADELKLSEGIENLVGTSVLTGAKDIDTSSLVTVICGGCGAAVTINSENTLSATCHWCRRTLSLNNPVDNGAIPDAILPFYVTLDDAAKRMATYVGERSKWATPEFTRDFEHASPRAVYLPYLVVDGKVTVRLEGRAWVPDRRSPTWGGSLSSSGSTARQFTTQVSTGSTGQQFITEEFAVMRETDLLVDDLAIEARSTRTKLYAAVSTTNIINAIQPFDVEHAVRFDANYITEGAVFERRDMEVSDAMGDAANLFATIARGYVNQTLKQYLGGVRWESEITAIKGTRWVSVLLPVWLYAFEENTPKGPMMHYIAVNGRTGETEGSVPIDDARARASGRKWGWVAAAMFGGPPVLIAAIVAVSGVVSGSLSPVLAAGIGLIGVAWSALSLAFGRFNAEWRRNNIAKRQRRLDARLKPELETKYTPTRFEQGDRSLGTFTHFGGPEIEGRNDTHPEVRAEKSKFVLGDLPQPTADEHSTADFVWNPERGAQFDKHGHPRAGQPPSAYPPGTVVGPTIQLIPGWRDSWF
jgi:hypothetical protein